MNKCLYCNTDIPDKRKFCSISHSTSFNNRGKRKHGRGPNKCLNCGEVTKTSKNKFCSMKCSTYYKNTEKEKDTEQKLNSGSYQNWDAIRKYFLKKHTCCQECGQTNTWNKKPLILHVDHIDGNSDNNSKDNFRVLCPNCHTQTTTWCARNKKNTKRNKYARQWRRSVRQMERR